MASTEQPYLGIDLGGTNIQAGLLDHRNKLLARRRTKTKADRGSQEVLGRIVKLVDQVLDEAELSRKDVAGLGIGAPGAIDFEKGLVLNATNLRWNNYPLAEVLAKELGMVVVVDNDVNIGAWGEQQLGAGRGQRDLLAVFVGTGIGGGLVMDGKLFHGGLGMAGEIGHTIIDADAPLGQRTLENRASRTAIVNRIAQLIRSNHPSVIVDLVAGKLDRIRSKVLADAYQQGDALTVQVIHQAAADVGVAIANTVTLLSLPCVVLGGGLTEALGEPWVKQVRAAFRRNVFPPEAATQCKIVAGSLGDDAGLTGAALLAREAASRARNGEKYENKIFAR